MPLDDAARPTLLGQIKDPAFVAYTLYVLLSVWFQWPVQQCFVVASVDSCGLNNTIATIIGCLYAGTKFGPENRNSGFLTFVAAVSTKLISMVVSEHHIESLIIVLVIYVVNVATHSVVAFAAPPQ